MAEAGSKVFLNGHSFLVNIEAGADENQTVTGEFEMHHVPPGAYELHLVAPNLRQIMEVVVTAGEVTDVELVNLCFPD